MFLTRGTTSGERGMEISFSVPTERRYLMITIFVFLGSHSPGLGVNTSPR